MATTAHLKSHIDCIDQIITNRIATNTEMIGNANGWFLQSVHHLDKTSKANKENLIVNCM